MYFTLGKEEFEQSIFTYLKVPSTKILKPIYHFDRRARGSRNGHEIDFFFLTLVINP